uniref:Mitogen-activated protein kinase kinase kinase 14b n=1 Tax=Astyanax mexicanus TaxID=7994 RepID=A0A3B1JT86_ASTMX
MAIPTMFHSSSDILEATSSSSTGGGHDPLFQTESETLMQQTVTEETGMATVTAHTEGEQWQEFRPSSGKHSMFQPPLSRSSSEAPSFRMHHEEHREGTEGEKEMALGQRHSRDRVVKKSKHGKEEKEKRASLTPQPLRYPEQEDGLSPTRFSFRSQSTGQGRCRPELESLEEHSALAPDFPHQRTHFPECPLFSAAGLCLHRLEVGCCSDIYSSIGGSDCAGQNSDPDSVYIYAESIKGSTCCSMMQQCDSICLYAEGPQMSFDVLKKDVFCKIVKKKKDVTGNTEESHSFEQNMSDNWSFDPSGDSTEAVFGSDNSCGSSDSLFMYADWKWSLDSNAAEVSLGSIDSLSEAQWGSASSSLNSGSEASCYTADCGSESSYCTVVRSCDSDCEDPFSTGRCCASPVGSSEDMSIDLYNAWTESSDGDEACCRGPEKEIVSDAPQCKDSSTVTLNDLRGVVTYTDHYSFSRFFCEMVKEAAQDRGPEKLNVSEGFLFHPQKFLQAKNSTYREGREYSFLRHIQNGSYGDVFSVRDKQTGFTCAAKKIPLSSFSWEEVGTWSRLDSPHVLQMYGAVREGPNVVLFMDLKTGSLAQLLKEKGVLPEALALYYHRQVLQALEHLHSRQVIHLDVKVDNVLLSKDGMECFLCDFGLSEMLDQTGCSNKTFRGNGLRGTESHMSPEVARGDPRSDKADVWSSCCMLLHMLSGHQPWTRYYTHPLCLKIVSEPAPLWEIPPGCDPLTCEVIRGGLVKEPRERDSARKLLEKTTKALQAVGEISDLVLTHLSDTPEPHNCQPMSFEKNTTTQNIPSSVPAIAAPCQDQPSNPRIQWVSMWREKAEEEDETDTDKEESEEENAWDKDGDMDGVKTDKMRVWMERYWGTEEDLAITDKQHSFSEDEREVHAEKEDCDIYSKVKIPSDEEEKDQEEEEEEEELDDTNCDLKEENEAETRSPVEEEAESENEGDDVEEELESDLDSLRELGSDWAEEEWEPFQRLQILYGSKAKHRLYLQHEEDNSSDTEEDSVSSTIPSGEKMNVSKKNSKLTLTCHRSTCSSEPELTDKNSDWSDDLSSGVFSSYSSLADGQSFNVDWSVSTNQPPSCCFEGLGVDIWVEDVSGETLRIREKLKVKLGHVAVGISAQISMRTFSLATLDGKLVSPDFEVLESGLWLQCIPVPDDSTCWDWRVRDGKLEKQEHDEGASDTCSTLAA